MFVRRLAAGACALCLVVPTAASAMPGGPVFTGHVHHTTAVVAATTIAPDAVAGAASPVTPRAACPARSRPCRPPSP